MEQLVRAKPINHILRVQLLTLGIIAILFYWQGWSSMAAGAFGSFIAIGNTLLIKWHLHQAAKTAGAYANKNLQRAYRCVAERWLFTIALFAIGFGIFAFKPFPLFGGFAVTQMVVLVFGNLNRA
jgi:ATP synthase protein I